MIVDRPLPFSIRYNFTGVGSMKYKRFLLSLVLISQATLLFMLPLPASAETVDASMTLNMVGVKNGFAYMRFETSLSGACLYSLVYINLATDEGRAMYSMALTARATKVPLSHIAYVLQDNVCYATSVEL